MKRFALALVACLAAGPALAGGDHKDCKGAAHKDCKHDGATVELKKMTVDQVASRLEKKEKIHIYDNNSKERYEKGHVPTAVWVAYDDLKPADLPADKAAELVFYCANERCMACHKAAKSAMALGYTNVHIMPEGIMGWEKAEKPTETAAPAKS